MTKNDILVSEQRKYAVRDVDQAREIALFWVKSMALENALRMGLPEIDDRYHIWRIPLLNVISKDHIGEVVVDARTSLILEKKSTRQSTLEARLLGKQDHPRKKSHSNGLCRTSSLSNTVALGDAEEIMHDLPSESIDLVFTSPPYFNARPEYTDYVSYEDYLLKLRKIIQGIHRVLNEGRFFAINVSPVLVRRSNRTESSRRIAVPFDIHRLFVEEGYDFVDDIIWVKPEGAGWATGRGRRFAADRNPLQYKPVPVTEYVLVYRKHTDKLIDWNIRCHPNKELVQASRIGDEYDHTNVWHIQPAYDSKHPAIFPDELVTKVITYYSFKNDVVLDPFAGIGTLGRVATKLQRRFVLVENDPAYVRVITDSLPIWLGTESQHVRLMNCTRTERQAFI